MECVNPPMPEKKKVAPKKVEKDLKKAKKAAGQEDVQKPLYKWYVGKGNSPHALKLCFKGRTWWSSHNKEDMNAVNFCWTQIRKKALMNTLKCKLAGGPMNEAKKGIEYPV
jgi:hypothetical protein